MSTDEAAGQDPTAPANKPKKKKRKKQGDAPVPAPARAEAKERRPSFAKDFPRDPALDALVEAFEAGNYATVRSQAPKLVQETDDDEVRQAARELLRRLEPDPLAKLFLATGVALLLVLSLWYWLHPRGGSP